jgi:pyruvate ferredoxin oxidoreductase gamma subunit
MEKWEFIREMQASYEHKFAKKPEVIEGNMNALKMTFDAIEPFLK